MIQVSGKEKERNKNFQLVFAICEHDLLGTILEGFIVELTDFRQFSLSARKVNPITIKDYNIPVTPEEHRLISLIEEYSDEVILKKFSRNKQKPSDFYKNLDSAILQKFIRPYIEDRIRQCAEIMGEMDYRLYYKGKRRDAIQERPIKINNTGAEVLFHFMRSEEGTEYFLTLLNGGKEIQLTGKKGKILTFQPCWLYVEDELYCVDSRVDGNKLLPFFSKKSIHVPKTSEQKYYEIFVQNALRHFVVKGEGFSVLEPHPGCNAILKTGRDLHGFAVLELSFDYGNLRVISNDPDKIITSYTYTSGEPTFIRVHRDFEEENLYIRKLKEMGLFSKDLPFFYLTGEIQADSIQSAVPEHLLFYWINRNFESLTIDGFKIEQSNNEKKYFAGSIQLDFNLEDQQDWFDLKAIIRFGSFEIPFIHLRHHILNEIREYQLPNGEIAIIPDAWFSRYRELVQLGSGKDHHIQVRKYHAGILKAIGKEQSNKILEELTESIKNKPLEEIRLPERIDARLRPYQAKGYYWMKLLQKHQLGGCLADDMGLGKTLQTLALLSSSSTEQIRLKVQPNKSKTIKQLDLFSTVEPDKEFTTGTSLIVMPLSLIWNWENEIKKFTPHLTVHKHIGSARTDNPTTFYNYDLVLTTYGIVRNDHSMFQRCEFKYVILDESQIIKNPFSKLFRSVRMLKAKYRLVLTGTPIENSLIDLWSQMTFLNPGILGNLAFFKDEFVIPIEKNRNPAKEERLREIITPLMLRRTKEMVAKDLPSLTETIYYCEMSDEQKEMYETRKSEIRNILLERIAKEGTEKARFIILKGLMELRLLANHPRMIPGGPDLPSGKQEEVFRTIESIVSEGHKVLVFSNFVKHLRLFGERLDEKGIQYSVLTGKVNTPDRVKAIAEFQNNSEVRLFLLTLKAGGVGLNLTAADYVFILDPWWNPAVENQAIGRAHRIGQDKKVIAFKFITRNTIEEKILTLQQNKSELASLFVNQNDPLRYFTTETIFQLTE